MGDVRTLLSPVVQEGGIWRVQIVWPNGRHTLVGKFTSEKDAVEWINAHPRLTNTQDATGMGQDWF
jgi:hypothetical protein